MFEEYFWQRSSFITVHSLVTFRCSCGKYVSGPSAAVFTFFEVLVFHMTLL